MEKIFKALLETKFNGNASMLLELANQTPNARVAIEKLCGIYESPVKGDFMYDRISKHGIIYYYKGYNEWTEQVEYSYDEPENKYYNVRKDIPSDIVLTMDNINEYKTNGDGKSVYIKTGKINKRTSYMYTSEWLTYESVAC